ncbi:MAG TPA: hypothetical protein VFD39_00160 [Trueperaceae bacterium]|nr:hypothetical protein [Trueperaceae bacterium]
MTLTSTEPAEQFERVVDQLLKEFHTFPQTSSRRRRRAALLTPDSVDDVAVFDPMIPSLRPRKAGQR